MLFSSFLSTAALTLFSISSNNAAVLPRSTQDVFVPQITSPTANTTWIMGTIATVTWDTSDAPVNISNGASVVLRGYGLLAKGFDLRNGSVDVTVPVVPVTSDNLHNVILFGDSGNISPAFKIMPSELA